MKTDKHAKCAKCGHAKDWHQRYVRNLSCCYECNCEGFSSESASLVLNNGVVRQSNRPPHEDLRREPLRSIPLEGGMHMVVHARPAKDLRELNRPAFAVLLAAAGLPAGRVPWVTGDAVVVNPDLGIIGRAEWVLP